jgi:hypothetical protein
MLRPLPERRYADIRCQRRHNLAKHGRGVTHEQRRRIAPHAVRPSK